VSIDLRGGTVTLVATNATLDDTEATTNAIYKDVKDIDGVESVFRRSLSDVREVICMTPARRDCLAASAARRVLCRAR